MRGKFAFVAGSAIGRGLMAVALTAGVATGGMVLGTVPAQAKEKAPKPGQYSPEFTKAVQPLQAAMNALNPFIDGIRTAPANGKEAAIAAAQPAASAAIALVPAAEAAVKNPMDHYLVGQWMQTLGRISQNFGLAQRGYGHLVTSGLANNDKGELVTASPQQIAEYKFNVAVFANESKDYAGVIAAATDAVNANYSDPALAVLLARAYVNQGQPAQGLAALKNAIAVRHAAGAVPPQTWYSEGLIIADRAKLATEAFEWSQLQVQAFPNARSWLNTAQVYRKYGAPTAQETLDMSRLMYRTGGIMGEPEDAPSEYFDYIQAASKAGLPAEVSTIAKAGIDKGVLSRTDPTVTDALGYAAAAAQDKARLGADEARARTSPDGKAALASGDSYLSFSEAGQGAEKLAMANKAAEMLALAIQKGGIDKDRALTRLALAQINAGKIAEAKATLAQVTGARAPLAKLYMILADQQAVPAS